MSLRTHQKGFTIVELLIVIVVIAILAAISIVAYTGIQDRARNTSAQSLASQIAKKAEVYYAIEGTYPDAAGDFTGEAALEGMKVTFGSTGNLGTTFPVAEDFNSVANMLSQFESGNRVIYVGDADGYAVTYRTGAAAATTMTKGSPPAGTYAWVSNENV